MKFRHFGFTLIAVALAGAGIVRPVSGQQARTCLHGDGETQEQAQRRQQALALTRQINTLESGAFARTRAFQALQQLPLTAVVPQGFAMQLASDGSSYVFSVKDTLDACRFGYFSDQDGVIFKGQALQ